MKRELIREGGGEIRGEDASMTEISRAGAASDLQAVISAAHTASQEQKFVLNLLASLSETIQTICFGCSRVWTSAWMDVCEKIKAWETEIKSVEAIVYLHSLILCCLGRWILLFKHMPWLSSCNWLSKKQTRMGTLAEKDKTFCEQHHFIFRFKR